MAEHERTDQYSGKKSKMTPRDECEGRDYRPTPNPSLAGGGTNPGIARQQDAKWTQPHSVRVSSQFTGK
jgi:hypothetical protein